MSSISKNILYSLILLMLFPMSAFADIKIIIGQPVYKYNHYSPKYNSQKYHHFKNKKYNKYNYAPYSYRSNHYKFADRNTKFYYPGYRYQPKLSGYNRYYKPYAYNFNNRQYQKAYKRGYRDGYRQKKHFKVGN